MRKLSAFLFAAVFITVFCLNAGACFNCSKRFAYTFAGAFDTSTTIIAYSPDKKTFDALCALVEEQIFFYHKLFDIYNLYDGINNLKTVNDAAGKNEIKVDPAIIELLKFGKSMYEASGGRLNIMLGAVLRIWHEYRENGIAQPEKAEIPEKAALEEASMHCDINTLVINEASGAVFITDPLAGIDVGAAAKGFAVQKTAEFLKERGFDSILINAGGNVAVIGAKANGNEWNVAVQSPDDPNGYIGDKLLTDASLATSGDYQRFYTVDGERYHHIINPETLFPARFMRSVTICAPRADAADALSTAVFLMPADKALEFIERTENAEALIMTNDGEIIKSSGWET